MSAPASTRAVEPAALGELLRNSHPALLGELRVAQLAPRSGAPAVGRPVPLRGTGSTRSVDPQAHDETRGCFFVHEAPPSTVLHRFDGLKPRMERAFFGGVHAVDGTSSTALGSRVDAELARWARADAAGRRLLVLSQHRYTRMVLEALGREGIEVCMSQVPIFSERARIGTALDLVGYVPRSGSLVLVEVKTGGAAPAAYDAPLHELPQPALPRMALLNVANSQRNRHLLQVALARHVIETEYGVRFQDAVVVVASALAQDARVYRATGELVGAVPAAYAALAAEPTQLARGRGRAAPLSQAPAPPVKRKRTASIRGARAEPGRGGAQQAASPAATLFPPAKRAAPSGGA